MHEALKDLNLGLTLTALFLLVYFIAIPTGIVIPTSHDPGQLSPAAYPTWVTVIGVCSSLALTLKAAFTCLRLKRGGAGSERKAGHFRKHLHAGLAYTLLFLFYFFLEEVGMVAGCFVLYAVFAIFCGERNWLRLLLIDCALTAALYLFFVRIASVPVPLGILKSFI